MFGFENYNERSTSVRQWEDQLGDTVNWYKGNTERVLLSVEMRCGRAVILRPWFINIDPMATD
jgi:hypothetical protein